MLFFRFLYTDELNLTADNVMEMLYASKKYLITNLKHKCIMYLDTNLNAQNACMLLYQSQLFDEQELVNKCLKVIDSQTCEALKSETFCDVDHATVLEIVTRDTLNVKEICLFECINKWCEAECGRKNLDPTGANRRTVLGDILYQIRMTEMTGEEFGEGPVRSGILSVQESNDVLLYLVSTTKPVVLFHTKARANPPLEYLICNQLRNIFFVPSSRHFTEQIEFEVSDPIIIKGIGMLGGSAGSQITATICLMTYPQTHVQHGQFQVCQCITKNLIMLSNAHQDVISDGTSKPAHIYFDSEIRLSARESCTIIADIRGPATCLYSGTSETNPVHSGGVYFTFLSQQRYSDIDELFSCNLSIIPQILFTLP